MATVTTYTGTPANSERIGDTASRTYQAQQFTATASGTLTTVKVYIQGRTGTPTDGITVQVWGDDGSDNPSSLISGATENISDGSLVVNGSWNAANFNLVTFTSPPSLTNGTKYWIVIKRQGAVNAANYYDEWFESGSTYTGGIPRTGTATPTWTTANAGDFPMEININAASGYSTLSMMGVG